MAQIDAAEDCSKILINELVLREYLMPKSLQGPLPCADRRLQKLSFGMAMFLRYGKTNNGWVSIPDLLTELNSRKPSETWLMNDVITVVNTSYSKKRKRFELQWFKDTWQVRATKKNTNRSRASTDSKASSSGANTVPERSSGVTRNDEVQDGADANRMIDRNPDAAILKKCTCVEKRVIADFGSEKYGEEYLSLQKGERLSVGRKNVDDWAWGWSWQQEKGGWFPSNYAVGEQSNV